MRVLSNAPRIVFPSGSREAFLNLQVKGLCPLVLQGRIEPNSSLRFRTGNGHVDSFSVHIKPFSLQLAVAPLAVYWTASEPPPINDAEQIAVSLATSDGVPKDGFNIEPDNRLRIWNPLYALVSSPRPAHLQIETQLLLLNGRTRQRVLSLFNAGETTLQLRPPIWPGDFEVKSTTRDVNEWAIRPGESKSWQVRALPSAKPGATLVEFLQGDGEKIGKVELLVPTQIRAETRTRYVLGVDFGTSGTSIWKRDGRDDRLPAEPLTDPGAGNVVGRDSRRFPTVLYVTFRDGHEVSFSIGYEALRRRAEDAGRGLWVSELKTLLRTEGDPYVTDYGPNYRVDLLLKRYLQILREQIILPQLDGGDSASVAWNFSLPVLDSHAGGSRELFNLQKSRLEKAIRAAGYIGTGDRLQFFTEPFCAAIYLLLQHGNYRYPRFAPPQDGDWACIFDSGGGTTDVVLGQLKLEEAQLRFEEVSTLGGYRTREKTGGEPTVATFGGEALTRTTAIYLSVWSEAERNPYDFLRYGVADLVRRRLLDGRNSSDVYQTLKQVAELAPGNEEILKQRVVPLPGRPEFVNPWERFPDLWDKVESYKRQFAGAGTPSTQVTLEFQALSADEQGLKVSIVRGEFDRVVVNRRLKAIGEEMKLRVFGEENVPAPVEVKWVFGVGGNCRVRRVQDWLQEFFPTGVQELSVVADGILDESDRMLAVAGGAVWASKASQDNTLPYSLRLSDEEGNELFHASAYVPLVSVKSREQIYDLPFEHSVRLKLQIEGKMAQGQDNISFNGIVGTFTIGNHHMDTTTMEDGNAEVARRSITVRVALEGRRFLVKSDESGQFEERFSYLI